MTTYLRYLSIAYVEPQLRTETRLFGVLRRRRVQLCLYRAPPLGLLALKQFSQFIRRSEGEKIRTSRQTQAGIGHSAPVQGKASADSGYGYTRIRGCDGRNYAAALI